MKWKLYKSIWLLNLKSRIYDNSNIFWELKVQDQSIGLFFDNENMC